MPRPASRVVMFEVVPWPTPTRATTDATPMTTPSIVSAARSRLVRRRESASRSSSSAFMRRSARRGGGSAGAGGRGDVGVVGDQDDRAAGGVELAEERRGRPGPTRCRGCRSARRRGCRAGSVTIARATATRCCWPPDSSRRLVVEPVAEAEPLEGGGRPGRPVRAARRPGRAAASRRCRAPSVRGSRLYDWKTKPIVRLRSRASAVVVELRDRRAGEAVAPAVGRSRQPMMFIIVLLPDPDGPTIATNSPWPTSRRDVAQGVDPTRPIA